MGMSQEIRADYAHMDLLPQSLEDWVAPDRPARCIREFVDALDLKELGFQLRESTVHGARAAPSENAVVASLHGLQLVQIARPVDQGKAAISRARTFPSGSLFPGRPRATAVLRCEMLRPAHSRPRTATQPRVLRWPPCCPFFSRKLACGAFTSSPIPRQQAGWWQSGSKLPHSKLRSDAP